MNSCIKTDRCAEAFADFLNLFVVFHGRAFGVSHGKSGKGFIAFQKVVIWQVLGP